MNLNYGSWRYQQATDRNVWKTFTKYISLQLMNTSILLSQEKLVTFTWLTTPIFRKIGYMDYHVYMDCPEVPLTKQKIIISLSQKMFVVNWCTVKRFYNILWCYINIKYTYQRHFLHNPMYTYKVEWTI